MKKFFEALGGVLALILIDFLIGIISTSPMWFNRIMHFAGGFLAARLSLYYWLWRSKESYFKASKDFKILGLLCGTFILASLWEGLQTYLLSYIFSLTNEDFLEDIIMGVMGGIIYSIFRFQKACQT